MEKISNEIVKQYIFIITLHIPDIFMFLNASFSTKNIFYLQHIYKNAMQIEMQLYHLT